MKGTRIAGIAIALACATPILPATAMPIGDPPPAPLSLSMAASQQALTQPSQPRARQSLRGKVIVIDPGHQLGNATHPDQINRLVNAGGFQKACNTTGTATNGGYPEATFAWKVAKKLRAQLRHRGATVAMTRHTNSYDDWGPCIDVRGRKGNKVDADAVVSIHGDGAASSVHGFFVIMPTKRKHWTADIYGRSRHLGHRVKAGLLRAGLPASSGYGGDGLDFRGDLGTLNWSDRPIVMVELGNMRNAKDARHMTNPKFRRHVYARGLRLGVAKYVRNH